MVIVKSLFLYGVASINKPQYNIDIFSFHSKTSTGSLVPTILIDSPTSCLATPTYTSAQKGGVPGVFASPWWSLRSSRKSGSPVAWPNHAYGNIPHKLVEATFKAYHVPKKGQGYRVELNDGECEEGPCPSRHIVERPGEDWGGSGQWAVLWVRWKNGSGMLTSLVLRTRGGWV